MKKEKSKQGNPEILFPKDARPLYNQLNLLPKSKLKQEKRWGDMITELKKDMLILYLKFPPLVFLLLLVKEQQFDNFQREKHKQNFRKVS
eukprot:11590_6